MDTLENAGPPQEQAELVVAECRECGQTKSCYEHVVCCTGTHFHTCRECRTIIERRGS
jgi:hypothetical protein